MAHESLLGYLCGIAGCGNLVAISVREHPGQLRASVSAFAFWLAVGAMAFLAAYVVAKRV